MCFGDEKKTTVTGWYIEKSVPFCQLLLTRQWKKYYFINDFVSLTEKALAHEGTRLSIMSYHFDGFNLLNGESEFNAFISLIANLSTWHMGT